MQLCPIELGSFKELVSSNWDFVRNELVLMSLFFFLNCSMGPPPMNMYVILMYVFKNANTQYDLNMVGIKMVFLFSKFRFLMVELFSNLQFKQFIKENISEKSRILTQAVEGVKTNINWMDQNYQTIVDWLRNITKS